MYDDKNGANAASRTWWMLKSFGLKNVQVLDGGIQTAEKEGLKFLSGEETFQKSELLKTENWLLPISSLEDVENELINCSATVIDVRDTYRFRGESEPIDQVGRSYSGAINIPFSENLDENGSFLST